MPETASLTGSANWIGGQPVGASSGATLDNVDPATGQVIGRIPRSDAVDVARAVAAAKRALPDWSALDVDARCGYLSTMADLLERRLDDLARLETQDTGKPITTSRTLDIPRAVRNLRFFADFARTHSDETYTMDQGWNYVQRRSVGVVGLVTPWNLPLYLLSWKVAPALAMGNTVVAKPSELTPQTASALAEVANDAGLPEGVLNIVHGTGPEAGQALVGHPDVAAVSFTGGTATGRTVAATAAPMFKKLSLELGGKNATVILKDADLEAAVAGAVRAGFTNGGQVCLCGSRILVHEGLAEAFVPALEAAVDALRPDDPMEPSTRLGPLVSDGHRSKVRSYIDAAHAEGARVSGASVPTMPGRLAGGFWLEPAVVTGVAQSSRLVQEEIFGPVVTVQTFSSQDEAVARANGVDYGLAGSVWGPEDEARQVAEAMDTGMVWVNDWLVRDLRVPFGGVKQSGVGREGGRWSLEFFSEPKNIYVRG